MKETISLRSTIASGPSSRRSQFPANRPRVCVSTRVIKMTSSSWLTCLNSGGVELVSPVYMASWYWSTDLETIFSVLRGSFALAPSSHCSTHVHVSATPLPLDSFELATLAKAALYFEPALDTLVPTNRHSSTAYWCQSNRANPSLANLGSIQDCFAVIDHAASISSSPSSSSSMSTEQDNVRAIVEAMNLFPAKSAYGKAHGRKKDFIRGKVYK